MFCGFSVKNTTDKLLICIYYCNYRYGGDTEFEIPRINVSKTVT